MISNPSFLERFFAIANQLPDHPAVVQAGKITTYSELLTFTRRLAHGIANERANARILIHLPQGPEAYGAMFASAMAGAVYAPINVAAPIDRQISVGSNFAPEIIVTHSSTRQEACQLADGARTLVVDELGDDEMHEPWPPNELVYVMYTSGSTGEPKGVMIPFDALSHYVTWAITAMDVQPTDRWSQHPNIAFDLSVLDIFGALCAGATLYPFTNAGDLMLPAKAIKRYGLTIWNSVPSVMSSMVKIGHVTKNNLESLRLLTFCGEPLLQLHLDAIFTALADVVVHNTYGPTEATVSCTHLRLSKTDYHEACRESVAIGDAIANMSIQLVGGDNEGEGEVVITGPQLAKGYWNDPKLTAESFRPLEIGGVEQPAYYTGDWARRDDGMIYFIGRKDNQVKVRGERVELDDIAVSIMRCHRGITTVAFIDGEMHAFLEIDKTDSDESSIREELNRYLPRHLIPPHFHFLKTLPRNVNDKIDRGRLIEWVQGGNSSTDL